MSYGGFILLFWALVCSLIFDEGSALATNSFGLKDFTVAVQDMGDMRYRLTISGTRESSFEQNIIVRNGVDLDVQGRCRITIDESLGLPRLEVVGGSNPLWHKIWQWSPAEKLFVEAHTTDFVAAPVFQDFLKKISPAKFAEFRELVNSSEFSKRYRAVEMVAFAQTESELFALGITQIKQEDRFYWYTIQTNDSAEHAKLVSATLKNSGFDNYFSSCNLGSCGWYVPRELFFRARLSLMKAGVEKERGVVLTSALPVP